MQRDIMTSLEKWGASTRHKPLILKGARQVGRTWALRKFGAKRFGPRETVQREVVAARKDECLNASGHCSEYANAESEGNHTSLGFSSQSYFTRVFRERTGFTPGEFRKRFFRESEMGGT